ncbi:hypothetical protein FRB99_008979 [Tulasnella sp. 403]|nr:hypothetical protein FRB99_008979 [Tulasnella sp. 403]
MDVLIDNLPFELLGRILLMSRDFVEYEDSADIVRFLLPIHAMLVCKSWHQVVAETLDFWVHVYVSSTTQPDTLSRTLARSKRMPLLVWVGTRGISNNATLECLLVHAKRWEALFLGNTPVAGDGEFGSTTIVSDVGLDSWIAADLEGLRYLHLGGTSIYLNNTPMEMVLPQLTTLSFGFTVPPLHLQNSPLLTVLRSYRSWVSISRLTGLLVPIATSLQHLVVVDVILTNLGSVSNGLPEVFMPNLQKMCFQGRGYDGLLKDLMRHITCPSLQSLTYSVPTDHHSQWTQVLTLFDELNYLDLSGQILPNEVLTNLLSCSPALQQLILPRLPSAGVASEVLDTLIEFCSHELWDLTAIGMSYVQLQQLVEVIPSIRRLDVTDSLTIFISPGNVEETAARDWLDTHVAECVGFVYD